MEVTTQNGTAILPVVGGAINTDKDEVMAKEKAVFNADELLARASKLMDEREAAFQRLQQLENEVRRVKEENEKLKAGGGDTKARVFACAVSEKGAVSISGPGIRKFGVHLYQDEWEAILPHLEEVRSFIKANSGKLKTLARK